VLGAWVEADDHEGRFNPGGNERLTAAVGLLVLAPIPIEVATVLLGVHTFMSWHVFVGLALIERKGVIPLARRIRKRIAALRETPR
jgi:hypothetical protein